MPEEWQQEEEDAPSVSAAAMVREALGALEGVVASPVATLPATPAASSTLPLVVRGSKHQLSGDKDYAALAGIK